MSIRYLPLCSHQPILLPALCPTGCCTCGKHWVDCNRLCESGFKVPQASTAEARPVSQEEALAPQPSDMPRQREEAQPPRQHTNASFHSGDISPKEIGKNQAVSSQFLALGLDREVKVFNRADLESAAPSDRCFYTQWDEQCIGSSLRIILFPLKTVLMRTMLSPQHVFYLLHKTMSYCCYLLGLTPWVL